MAAALAVFAAPAQAAMINPTGPGGGGNSSHATIIVVTNVVNDNGGVALPGNFLMTYGDGISVLSTWAGFPAPGHSLVVPTGTYVVKGASLSWYVRSYGPGCSGTFSANGFATCVVTYDDVALGTPGCENGCDVPPSTPPGCMMTSCDPITPPGCPIGSPDCAPSTPPDVATCDPLSPGCNPSTPPGDGSTPPNGGTDVPEDSSAGEELPRTGGATFPFALILMASAVFLSLRKRS